MEQNIDPTVPVSVVICARNSERTLGRCLDSVLAAQPAEIILIDDYSTDGTAALARARGAHVITNPYKGLGAARQFGAQVATQEFICFIDSDVLIEPDTLSILVDDALAGRYDAVQAKILALTPTTYWEKGEGWRRTNQSPGPSNVLACACTLYRRDLFERVKFDHTFTASGQDADFSFRARAMGARLGRSAKAIAYHKERPSFKQFAHHRIWHGRGLARLLLRYRGEYFAHAKVQASTASGAMRHTNQYLWFNLVAWSCIAIGVVQESVFLLGHPELRKSLSAESVAFKGT